MLTSAVLLSSFYAVHGVALSAEAAACKRKRRSWRLKAMLAAVCLFGSCCYGFDAASILATDADPASYTLDAGVNAAA